MTMTGRVMADQIGTEFLPAESAVPGRTSSAHSMRRF